MLLALDEGDATTTTETALIAHEEDEDVHGTDGMPTRKSTRSRKQVEDNNFVSLFKFSCHGQRHFALSPEPSIFKFDHSSSQIALILDYCLFVFVCGC